LLSTAEEISCGDNFVQGIGETPHTIWYTSQLFGKKLLWGGAHKDHRSLKIIIHFSINDYFEW